MIRGRSWPFWTFIVLLVVAHLILHLALGLEAEAPDLLTVAVLLAARRLSGAAAAAVGLVVGLVRDSLSLVAFGVDGITLTILGYLGARSRDFFVGESLVFIGLYLFIGKWLHDLIYYLIAGSALPGNTVYRLLVQAPLGALYAAAAGLIALLIYRVVSGER